MPSLENIHLSPSKQIELELAKQAALSSTSHPSEIDRYLSLLSYKTVVEFFRSSLEYLQKHL